MKVYFHGATGGVTGSAYHVMTRHASVLVDCGLFQGRREERAKNWLKDRIRGGRLDSVVLTHGEDRARKALSNLISARYDLKPALPQLGDCLEI